jgi:hypothetical protein
MNDYIILHKLKQINKNEFVKIYFLYKRLLEHIQSYLEQV